MPGPLEARTRRWRLNSMNSMQNLHSTVTRLYPHFPRGVRHLEIHISNELDSVHIETDCGVPSPYRTEAKHHLHIRASIGGWNPVVTVSLVQPRMVSIRDIESSQRSGTLAIETDATFWLYVPTAFTADLENSPLRCLWSDDSRIMNRKAHFDGVTLIAKFDAVLGAQPWFIGEGASGSR